EHDIMERHDKTELRGVLTHLREILPSEIEKLFQRLLEKGGFFNLKCLLMPIQPQEELITERMDLIERTLEEMKEGEVRTLST
ncbi:MAG TPA: hypothetical protein VLK23_18265, partial [Thermodesulfobacteriota bacterium]|nr:hypothetical protein [Thermodesulfobacteriota bacterium]